MTEAKPGSATPVSRAQALTKAKAETKFLGGDLDSAYLVYYTDPWFGKQTSDAEGAPIIPFSDHRLTWLVLFRHATQTALVPMGKVLRMPTAVAAFVDAHTGGVIEVSTINDLH